MHCDFLNKHNNKQGTVLPLKLLSKSTISELLASAYIHFLTIESNAHAAALTLISYLFVKNWEKLMAPHSLINFESSC